MPSDEKILVDICIATYRRQKLLKELLLSILNQDEPTNFRMRIIVIDNDKQRSAESVTKSVLNSSDIPFIYDVQKEKNIALTRNKALDYAEGKYVAFVDDDEIVSKNWLSYLIWASEQYDADVVFGPVSPVYPDQTPNWIKKGGFFGKGGLITGSIVTTGATCNALVSLKVLNGAVKIRFNPDYGITGGSDTELFKRIHETGKRLIWCAESYVSEFVLNERMETSWLFKRAFRGGQCYARIYCEKMPIGKKLFWLLNRFSKVVISVSATIVLFPFGKPYWVRAMQKIMSNAGQLSTVFTRKYFQEYRER